MDMRLLSMLGRWNKGVGSMGIVNMTPIAGREHG